MQLSMRSERNIAKRYLYDVLNKRVKEMYILEAEAYI